MFVGMTAMNFWALQYLQLTVTSSIFFSAPLIVALLERASCSARSSTRAAWSPSSPASPACW